jgi:hypothetical protein
MRRDENFIGEKEISKNSELHKAMVMIKELTALVFCGEKEWNGKEKWTGEVA